MPELDGTAAEVGSLLASGTVVLGRFRCERLLKSGRGVDTYFATELDGGAHLVLKRVVAGDVDDAVRIRLEHEAQVLRRLRGHSFHSSITVAHDAEFVYLVTPYVTGVTLEQRLAEGPLSVVSTIRVGIELLNALQAAHDNGVLHRDVKPANVIVDTQEPVDEAVLIDFGFARSSSLDLSLQNEPVGTARYLAPEAAGLMACEVDERSDLYSVGVLLFECLAGRPPFEAAEVGAVLRQHLNTP
ncbi:MAG: serine/threonine protein kinase, partial [Actinomycetota bacterium]|nr:serine/threonine protein kinase [Actinomycetota bacterium]